MDGRNEHQNRAEDPTRSNKSLGYLIHQKRLRFLGDDKDSPNAHGLRALC